MHYNRRIDTNFKGGYIHFDVQATYFVVNFFRKDIFLRKADTCAFLEFSFTELWLVAGEGIEKKKEVNTNKEERNNSKNATFSHL